MDRWSYHPEEEMKKDKSEIDRQNNSGGDKQDKTGKEGKDNSEKEDRVDKTDKGSHDKTDKDRLVKTDKGRQDKADKEGQENTDNDEYIKSTTDIQDKLDRDEHVKRDVIGEDKCDNEHLTKPCRDGEENDDGETKVMNTIPSVEDEHLLEPLTYPSSCVLYSNGLKAICREECQECSVIRGSIIRSPESADFWKSIKTGPSEDGCHRKFMSHFLEALDDYASDPWINDKKTIALMKQLLRVDPSDMTARVAYSQFARLVLYFGPIRKNDCIMIKQIHSIVQKSPVFTNKNRTETVSWFAGDMDRESAESLLKTQPSGTYLVRMSQTTPGCFAVSVTSGDMIHHFAIEADIETALGSCPYNANLRLHTLLYPTLLEAVLSLRSRALVTEDGLEIMCRKCCPNLPIHSIVSGYLKSTKRR